MAFPDITRELIDRIITPPDKLIFLTGSGISYEAGYPTWDEFVINLLVGSGALPDRDSARRYLAAGNRQVIAEGARAVCKAGARRRDQDPDNAWLLLVARALHPANIPDDAIPPPTTLHHILARHAAAHGLPILTTNFDLLHEGAASDYDRSYVFVRDDFQLGESFISCDNGDDRYLPTVFHLHGYVDDTMSQEGETLTGFTSVNPIVTQSDYNKVLRNKSSWQLELLNAIRVSGFSLFIVGHSLTDHDLQAWFEAIRDATSGSHNSADSASPTETTPLGYLVIAKESLGPLRDLEDADFADYRRLLEKQWEELGITVLITEHFSDATTLIEEHLYRCGADSTYRSDNKSPQERVSHIFSSIVNSDRLETTSRALAKCAMLNLEDDRLARSDVSVWLADGSHQLHRIGKQGHVFLTPEVVKTISTRPGSMWVAAQALHSETQRVETEDIEHWDAILGQRVTISQPDKPPTVCGSVTIAVQLADGDDAGSKNAQDLADAIVEDYALRDHLDKLVKDVADVLEGQVETLA
ncbi:SIR2 family protein [Actinomyces sp.]|uniref:SIR2 family protein n=1 Tax=Actinomyces sp. TaxID=29317 RepID=UPI0026DD0A5A|nr:SIR2 family protein [Actinomyces sp.]MDO4900940.1 SIR2 family protein [Actinomyces sp.]